MLARAVWAILVSTALAFSVLPIGAQTFTTPAVISSGVPGGLALIDVDAKDNIDIAWSTGQGVFFRRSTDGGKSFATPVIVSTGVGGGALQMNVDRSGGVYLLWQSSDMHFLLSRSTDGATFSTASDLTVALNMGTFSGSLPTMALDSGGNVNLVWPQFGSSSAVFFSRSADGGATFSAPVRVGNFVYAARTQIAIDSAGEIFVLWPEETTQAGTTCALRFNRSTNSGATFSPTLTLNSADAECDARLLINATNNLNVLSFDGSGTSYRSGDGGRNFLNSQNVFQPTTVWFGGQLNGNLQGINVLVNSFPNHDVLFSKSSDDGATFSRPILVSAAHPAATPGGAFGGNSQTMTVDPSGNINVVWEDDILTPGASDIFFSRSSDAGATFSTGQNISQNPGSGSPHMALDSQGNINVVWTAADASKVFFSRAAVTSANSGFTISAAPASMTTLPGGSATAQVTVTATGGFNQPVSLSCGNLPQGAECSFNPATVTPSTSGTLVGLTLIVPPTLSTGGFSFTVTASTTVGVSTATISQFQTMQVTVGALTGSVAPAAATIALGGSANFAVTVVGSGNFAGQFNLTCNAPAGVACTLTPSSGFLPINGRVTSILTVQIVSLPATGGAPKNPLINLPGLPLAQRVLPIFALLFLLSVLAFAFLRGQTRGFAHARALATLAMTVALSAGMLSCGGSVSRGSFSGGGTGTVATGGTTTPAGSKTVTFPVTVMAQSGGGVINVGTVSVTVP